MRRPLIGKETCATAASANLPAIVPEPTAGTHQTENLPSVLHTTTPAAVTNSDDYSDNNNNNNLILGPTRSLQWKGDLLE